MQRSFRINKYQSKPTQSDGKNSDHTDKKDNSFHSSAHGVVSGKVSNVALKMDKTPSPEMIPRTQHPLA